MRLLPLLALFAGLLCARADAAPPPPPFPFVIPWDDAAPGTATDVSFLNREPAGAHGFIVARNGHFVESGTGRRVRFLGVVFTFDSAFPTHPEAEKVAARLAKYGVNLVRIHYIDAGHGGASSIWDPKFADHRHVDADKRDRLDYLIAQFKKRGVYVNLNLHVARTFTPEDGFPESVRQIPFDFDKRVDEFDARMIALQKEYARDYLTHVNPYTRTAYTREPGVFCVEINNENSLVGLPWEELGGKLADLPEPFRGELRDKWNGWLKAKHGTTAKLASAWGAGADKLGPELLPPTTDAARWTLETHTQALATMEAQGDNAITVHVPQTDGFDWHTQLSLPKLTLAEGQLYTLTFRAKGARDFRVGATLDQADWHGVGLSQTVRVTPDWKDYQFAFTAHSVVPGHVRLTVTLGEHTGDVSLADVSLRRGAVVKALGAWETLEARTVPLPAAPISAQRTDWLLFLADTELSYATGMRDYLKKGLGLRSLVVCSQAPYGGLSGLYRERAMDFLDNHAYWDHPQAGQGWDPVGLRLNNTSLVPEMAKSGALLDLAQNRLAGVPYSVSEYNHPAPNEYQAECLPLLASVAAFQDWDVLTLHEYGGYGAGHANDKVGAYFAIGANPAKWAFYPSAALLFRQGAIAPAPARAVAAVPTQFADVLGVNLLTAGNVWAPQAGVGDALLSRRMELAVGAVPDAGRAAPTRRPSPLRLAAADPAAALFTADAPTAKVVAGFTARRTVRLKGAAFTFGDSANRFGVLTLATRDGKSLAQSSQALLTLMARVQNADQHWAADRHHLTSWGTGPTVVDGLPVTVSLTVDGPRKVYALDGTGARRQNIPAAYKQGQLTFIVSPKQQTVWYAVVK